jgi:hypothetical protein
MGMSLTFGYMTTSLCHPYYQELVKPQEAAGMLFGLRGSDGAVPGAAGLLL